MNDKLKLFQSAAKKAAADEQFLAHYVNRRNGWIDLKCTQEKFYLLCLCKRPKLNDIKSLKKIADFCEIDFDILKKYLNF